MLVRARNEELIASITKNEKTMDADNASLQENKLDSGPLKEVNDAENTSHQGANDAENTSHQDANDAENTSHQDANDAVNASSQEVGASEPPFVDEEIELTFDMTKTKLEEVTLKPNNVDTLEDTYASLGVTFLELTSQMQTVLKEVTTTSDETFPFIDDGEDDVSDEDFAKSDAVENDIIDDDGDGGIFENGTKEKSSNTQNDVFTCDTSETEINDDNVDSNGISMDDVIDHEDAIDRDDPVDRNVATDRDDADAELDAAIEAAAPHLDHEDHVTSIQVNARICAVTLQIEYFVLGNLD